MSHLLAPLTTGPLRLANRLVLPPMATSKAEDDGSVSQALLDYYDEKSRGNALGLVITEHCFVARQGQARVGQPSVADDSMLHGLTRLAAVIHANGPKAVVQINHTGGAASSAVTAREVVSASDVPSPIGPGEVPRALTAEEITSVVGQFAAAARRVKQAGFDGVEIHSAHGYLLNQFFSPITNRRTDEYGGDVLGRIRIHLEVIAAVRQAVGDGYPILLRLGASDFRDGGTSVEDSVAAAIEFERAGLDLIDVTGGLSGYVWPGHDEPGYFAELSAPIKRAVSIPVILTGGVTEPEHAEELLARGVADLIGVGRAMLKDAGWAVRAVDQYAV
jgi:2,4-dienoyl-CoA reductase-like NADH-dependent reductase (Old Yellow Enzyme family)